MTHIATHRISPIGCAMLFLVISCMIGRSGGRAMTHNTIFRNFCAIMTFQAVFHSIANLVTIKGFPVGYCPMTSWAVRLFVGFMRKEKRFFKSVTFPVCVPWVAKMAKSTIAFLSAAKMTFQTSRFTRPTKTIIYIMVLPENILSWFCCQNGRWLKHLPSGWQSRSWFRLTAFAINMALITSNGF